MADVVTATPNEPVGPTPLPPLVDGEQLTREEFHRRYEAMPEGTRAELIEGVVYMPSPVNHVEHGDPHSVVVGWTIYYRGFTPGVTTGDNSTLRLEDNSEVQPDGLLFLEGSAGGRCRIGTNGYLTDAPELLIEVAASSVSIDRGTKLRLYQRAGVREYILWRTRDAEVDWFVLRDGGYVLLPTQPDGTIRSETFPGLWLDPVALVVLNVGRVLTVLAQGLASPEHAAFVEQLRQRMS
jgi:Uma2 family endonuclease